MATCSYCNADISANASTCPRCGEPDPAVYAGGSNIIPWWAFALWFLLMGIGVFIGWQVGGEYGAFGSLGGAIIGLLIGGGIGATIADITDTETPVQSLVGGLGLLALIVVFIIVAIIAITVAVVKFPEWF